MLSTPYALFSQNASEILGPYCNWEAQALSSSCYVFGQLIPSLHWWLGPELLPENCSNSSVQLSLGQGSPGPTSP